MPKKSEARWVFGTRTNKWEKVLASDRDYIHGITPSEMKKLGKSKAKEKYFGAHW
jgi:hypothetical protein